MPTNLLSTKQVAERKKVTPWTVARWVREKHLEPALRVDGKRGAMWFDADEIEAFTPPNEAA